jgi:hypothetical protein
MGIALGGGVALADGGSGGSGAVEVKDIGDKRPIYDLTDAGWRSLGIDPARIVGRMGGTGNSVVDSGNRAFERNIRSKQAIPAYDHSGNRVFFTVIGLTPSSSFLTSAARQTADSYNIYVFPRAANAPFALAPKRQADVVDLRNGYFSNDPIGLWKTNFVRFTPAAGTPAGQAALAPIVARNGADADGTPVIKTVGEIETLRQQGLVAVTVPAADGSQGFRWLACPVWKDPRHAFRAGDVLAADRDAQGNVLPEQRAFVDLFNCLVTTGVECGSSRSDVDRSGSTDLADLFMFLGGWFDSAPEGDFDNSGSCDLPDVFNYLSCWFAGC